MDSWKNKVVIITGGGAGIWRCCSLKLPTAWRFLARGFSAVLALDLAQAKGGGKKTNQQGSARADRRMVAENPTWGAPRIHGELLKLGSDISERTVSRWVKRANHDRDSGRRWLAFFWNHAKQSLPWISSPCLL